jgi:hypothetical protein
MMGGCSVDTSESEAWDDLKRAADRLVPDREDDQRRQFWERCAVASLASRAIVLTDEAAATADAMLAEWDKRWGDKEAEDDG